MSTTKASESLEPRTVAVMDTTLRDGEQTPNVSYTPEEKLLIARRLLGEAEVDRIEVASTRVSEGEHESASLITKWARKNRVLRRVEMLGYCDGTASVDWITSAGGKVMNLLTKGSEHHCRMQLRMEPEEHRAAIEKTVRYARRKRLAVNVYLEDWSRGVRDSFDYVFALVNLCRELRVERVYLADTLGILAPADVTRYVDLMTSTWPEVDFEFHGHNDYGLAVANCLAAIDAGARGVHTSVNSMGERAGNTSLAQVVAAIHDHSDMRTGVIEQKLTGVSQLVATYTGKDIAANAPIVGRDVFTQTAGIHADGDAKADLYGSRLAPRRFGRAREYALGKLSGKASLDHNLEALGVQLSSEHRDLVLARIIELGDLKHTVSSTDLPYIINDVLETAAEQFVRVEKFHVVVDDQDTPTADVAVSYMGRIEKASATGDGGYDAFMRAIKKAVKSFEFDVPVLEDFRVRIPPGGRTSAIVETIITWNQPAGRAHEGVFTTTGVHTDQLNAAILATEKMLNMLVQPNAVRAGKSKAATRKRKKGSGSKARKKARAKRG
ncbi:MAG: alpha-isopropylmalate synthase regulatory domain-containing protein [Myxococcota bacterium]|jgi:D-citramalate synthase|nr:alpha-isopropylmalate synthase regulatory domain-containing protein [Myxococcota bacterium]